MTVKNNGKGLLVGRPRIADAKEFSLSESEKFLFDESIDVAINDGISFEKAFAKVRKLEGSREKYIQIIIENNIKGRRNVWRSVCNTIYIKGICSRIAQMLQSKNRTYQKISEEFNIECIPRLRGRVDDPWKSKCISRLVIRSTML